MLVKFMVCMCVLGGGGIKLVLGIGILNERPCFVAFEATKDK